MARPHGAFGHDRPGRHRSGARRGRVGGRGRSGGGHALSLTILRAARPALRASARAPVAAAAALSLVVAALPAWRGSDAGGGLLALRGTALLLATGLAYVVDDHAATTLAASPTVLAYRLGLRVAHATAVFAPVWVVAIALAPDGVPRLGATLEAVALLAAALAISATTDTGAAAAGPALAAGLVLTLVGQQRYPRLLAMLAGPTDPWWRLAQARWAAVLATGLVVLAIASRDPAARLRRRRP